jgi:2-polyprenyl-3-methyl-5-hydroxy-6-metoxy-1,4-benzoquinol methylase
VTFSGHRPSYTGDRPDVLRLVPTVTRRVLDVGCATGRLGAALAQRTGAEVWGVEPNRAFAAEARRRLYRVIARPVEDAIDQLDGAMFDLIVCADVLEHLADPACVLLRLRPLMTEGGRLVVSLPNVRFFDTFVQLGLRGTWPQRARGVHDRSHRHWFTDRDARTLFSDSGYEVESAAANYRLVERPSRVNKYAQLVALGPLRGFLAYQYLYRLRRSSKRG